MAVTDFSFDRKGKVGERDDNPTHLTFDQFWEKYGGDLTDRIEPLIMLLIGQPEWSLGDGSFDDIKLGCSEEFAAEVGSMREWVDKTIAREHKGAFRRHGANLLRSAFSEGSDWAGEHGDFFEVALLLVMPQEAKTVVFRRQIQEATGVVLTGRGLKRQDVLDRLDQAVEVLKARQDEIRKKYPQLEIAKGEGAPSLREQLEAQRQRNQAMRKELDDIDGPDGLKSKVAYVRVAFDPELRKARQAQRGGGGRKKGEDGAGEAQAPRPKTEREKLVAEIARLTSEVNTAREELDAAYAARKPALISEKDVEARQKEHALGEVRARLEVMDRDAEEAKRIGAQVAGIATPPSAKDATAAMPTTVVDRAAQVVAQNAIAYTPEAIEDAVQEFEAELVQYDNANQGHTTKIETLTGEVKAATVARDYPLIARLATQVSVAQNAITQNQQHIDRINAKLTELRAKLPQPEPVVEMTPEPAAVDEVPSATGEVAEVQEEEHIHRPECGHALMVGDPAEVVAALAGALADASALEVVSESHETPPIIEEEAAHVEAPTGAEVDNGHNPVLDELTAMLRDCNDDDLADSLAELVDAVRLVVNAGVNGGKLLATAVELAKAGDAARIGKRAVNLSRLVG